jgi:hypothetical protein
VTVPITGVFKPPTAKCALLSLKHGKLVAGRPTELLVTASGASSSHVRVQVTGPGIHAAATTDASGHARLTVTPSGVGVLTVRLVQAPSCRALTQSSIPGAFKPPKLTG